MLALWQAFYRVEPWGSDYERHAVQATLLDRIRRQIAASAGTRSKGIEFDDFMPGEWKQSQQIEVNTASLKAAEAAFAKRWG